MTAGTNTSKQRRECKAITIYNEYHLFVCFHSFTNIYTLESYLLYKKTMQLDKISVKFTCQLYLHHCDSFWNFLFTEILGVRTTSGLEKKAQKQMFLEFIDSSSTKCYLYLKIIIAKIQLNQIVMIIININIYNL